MSEARVIHIMLLVGFLLALWSTEAASSVFDTGKSEDNYPIIRQIRYSFTANNSTDRLVGTGELWVHAPVKQTSTQKCLRIETSHPCDLKVDSLGNQALHFALGDLPPYGSKIITVKADIAFSRTSNPLEDDDFAVFLKPEQSIESDHTEIIKVATSLRGKTAAETAENIFRWVAGNIQYSGYLPEKRGALYALRMRKGDCTEFADLFTALCLANGIPARGVAGYVRGENVVLKPDDFHDWAEFYEDGIWKIADPQKNIFLPERPEYISMRIINETSDSSMRENSRYRLNGDGLKVTMNH